MSIHPEFAERILSGEKRVEFRRRPLGRFVTHIVIYATAPVCAVIGVAEIQRVERGTPTALWDAFSRIGGIERGKFFGYFNGALEGFAYVLERAQSCASPLRLGKVGLPMRAPQAFQYLETRTLDAVLRKASPAGVMAVTG
jgi:predicted transcriptional regulator